MSEGFSCQPPIHFRENEDVTRNNNIRVRVASLLSIMDLKSRGTLSSDLPTFRSGLFLGGRFQSWLPEGSTVGEDVSRLWINKLSPLRQKHIVQVK